MADLQEAWDEAAPVTPARQARPQIASGLSLASRAVPRGMGEKIRSTMEFAAPSILPTAGSLALPAAATAIAGPANAPFVPLEAGAGGMMGTALNKLLGISDPTTMDYALAGGVPLAGQVASNIGRAIKPFVPMSKAAETMQPLAR